MKFSTTLKVNKNIKCFALVVAFVVFIALFLYSHPSKLILNDYCNIDGIHTFYLYSANSNAQIVSFKLQESACKFNAFMVKGESLFLPFNKNESAVNEYIGSLLSEYNAKLQLIESASFIDSEYYYTNKITNYVIINGNKVNIHVAKGRSGITVGTPIIFGSF